MSFDSNAAVVLSQSREMILYQPIDFKALALKELSKISNPVQMALNQVGEQFNPQAFQSHRGILMSLVKLYGPDFVLEALNVLQSQALAKIQKLNDEILELEKEIQK